jgi:intergrase/recombinase
MAFAKIKKEIKQTSNVKDLIHSVYKKFEVDLNEGFNFKSLYQLAELANSEGAYSNDYYSVNLFFEDKVEEIIGSKLDVPKHFTYKADLLLTLANIYLRKRHFIKSELYLQKAQIVLNECMLEFRKSRGYQIKTLQSLCLTYSGRLNESIDLLINLNTEDLRSAYANLVLASNLFLKGEIKSSKSLIGKYYRSDSYYEKNLDREWVLNKMYIEVIIAIETGNIDYAESRMNSLIRRYGGYLKTQPQSHIIRFVKLVRYYCRYPEEVISEKFAAKVDATIKWKPSEQEDLFFMTIFAWLKSKMYKKSLYAVVLELVSNSSEKNN